MGRTARPLHDPGNNGAIERGSNLQAARRGGLMKPAKPAGERKNTAALTPSLGTRSRERFSAEPLRPCALRNASTPTYSGSRRDRGFEPCFLHRLIGSSVLACVS